MRILAIDPNQVATPRLTRGLAQEGFSIDRAVSLQKGLWMARTVPYDAILLFLTSYKILCETLDSLAEESPSAFFIALLPSVTLENKIQLFERGMDEIIVYPCSFRELVLRIRTLLRREKCANSDFNRFEVDDLLIDLEKFMVRRGRKNILLRRKEFDLLYFLFRNQGKVLSKVNIMEGVWDSNADTTTNTLEVHILNLRRKIDNGIANQHRLIHTVYGRGYLFGLRFSGTIPATASSENI